MIPRISAPDQCSATVASVKKLFRFYDGFRYLRFLCQNVALDTKLTESLNSVCWISYKKIRIAQTMYPNIKDKKFDWDLSTGPFISGGGKSYLRHPNYVWNRGGREGIEVWVNFLFYFCLLLHLFHSSLFQLFYSCSLIPPLLCFWGLNRGDNCWFRSYLCNGTSPATPSLYQNCS